MDDSKIKPKVIKFGKEYPYKNCSQGERGRINLALLLAIRNILQVLGKSVTNLLFIDELLNIIDAGGKKIIVNTLSELDLNSFIICHDFTFDVAQLELVKKDNMTYVQD
jgi:DNA repair exonuclease SbcCD ATPase subunit